MSGMESTTARGTSLRFSILVNTWVYSTHEVIFCDSSLQVKFLLFTPQGSLSLVVPDQMHWRGDADFPKVKNNDHEIYAFGLQFN